MKDEGPKLGIRSQFIPSVMGLLPSCDGNAYVSTSGGDLHLLDAIDLTVKSVGLMGSYHD